MTSQVYKKVGRKYIPLGYSDGWVGFPSEGIWVVYNNSGSHSSTCIAQVGKFQDLDYSLLANLVKEKEYNCLQALMKLMDKGRYSQSDIVNIIFEEICRK